MRCALLLIVLIVGRGAAVNAETSREAASRLGVDVVLLSGGREARGSIVKQGEDGAVTIAVRRGWLQSRQPEWLIELDQSAADRRAAAQQTLIDRIQAWLAERPEPKLAVILRIELERIEKAAANKPVETVPDDSGFLLIEVPAGKARRVYAQPTERKQLALVAWDQQLDNVEATGVNRLREELERRKVDWRKARIDLSGRLAADSADGDREWAIRQAVYEFTYGQQVTLQGTGDFVVRTGTDAPAPGGLDLLAGVLEGGLAADLGGLLDGSLDPAVKPAAADSWLEQASRIAGEAGVRGFRLTRTDPDVQQGTVTVEDRFIARMPDGTWESIFVASETLDGTAPCADLEARIRADGQVSSALKLVEGLGLGGQIDTAVRFGAATMEAQQSAGARLTELIDRYSQRLDGPVLTWDASAQ